MDKVRGREKREPLLPRERLDFGTCREYFGNARRVIHATTERREYIE